MRGSGSHMSPASPGVSPSTILSHLSTQKENKGHCVPTKVRTQLWAFLASSGLIILTHHVPVHSTDRPSYARAQATSKEDSITEYFQKKRHHNKQPPNHPPTNLPRRPMKSTSGEEIPQPRDEGEPTTLSLASCALPLLSPAA